MIIYSIVTDIIPLEVPYNSWEEIPEDAWNDIDKAALEELRHTVAINDEYLFRHYKYEEDAMDQLGI